MRNSNLALIRKIFRKILRQFRKTANLLHLILRSLFMKRYCIKRFYICNVDWKGKPIPYLDSVDDASVFQYEEYEFARKAIERHSLKSVLDIGCGLGMKLADVIYPICKDITGIDTRHAVDACRQRYDFGQWLIDDIENPRLKLDKDFDLVIASDVIEHLFDPDKMLSYIRGFCNKDTLIIISTPQRDLVRGKNYFGHPGNETHVREWNMSEFDKYITSRGFKILEHFLAKDRRDSNSQNCQVVQCKLI